MATNFATASYQEIVDISTTPQKVGVFGIHTPDTIKPVQMLNGFYRQFRQFKYLGCDVKIQPAATLPADPLGVSYEAGEATTSDPRDLLNPIMVKGCHGETISDALDIAYRDNQNIGDALTRTDYDLDPTDGQSVIYYSALSDPTFRKYGVLQPFRLGNLHPLVHKVVGTMPIYPKQNAGTWGDSLLTLESEGVDDDSNLPYYDSVDKVAFPVANFPNGITTRVDGPGSDVQYLNGTFFTSRMEKLGWLDTISRPQKRVDAMIEIANQGGTPGFGTTDNDITTSQYNPFEDNTSYKFNTVPRLFMSVMIMPPCYKTILSFRMVINHKFAFRGFTSSRHPSLATSAYYEDLSEVGTASATSVETLNGTSTPVTDGVY